MNQEIKVEMECAKIMEPLERGMCRSRELKRRKKEYEERLQTKRTQLSGVALNRFDEIQKSRWNETQACLSKRGMNAPEDCYLPWYSQATPDLNVKIDWKTPNSKTEISNLETWVQELQKISVKNKSQIVNEIRKILPSFNLAKSLEFDLGDGKGSISFEIERIKVQDFDQKLGNTNKRIKIVAMNIAAADPNEVALDLIFLFTPTLSSGGELVSYFEEKNEPCQQSETWVVKPSPQPGPLLLKEQMVVMCGSTVEFDYRNWECSFFGERLHCFVLNRSDN